MCDLTFNGVTVFSRSASIDDYKDLGLTVNGDIVLYYGGWIWYNSDGSIRNVYESFSSLVSNTYVDRASIRKRIIWEVEGDFIRMLYWELPIFEWNIAGLS